MKKLVLIAIIISYSVASFGVSLNYFYCCGKLKTISLAPQQNAENGCKSSSKKGCCKNKRVTIQLKIDQKQLDQVTYQFGVIQAEHPQIFFSNFNVAHYYAALKAHSLYKRPPPFQFASFATLFCVFRI